MNTFITCCFLILIILVFSYINSQETVEAFTPKLREMYRPYVRNTRIYYTNFYNKTKNRISNLFRKIGIL